MLRAVLMLGICVLGLSAVGADQVELIFEEHFDGSALDPELWEASGKVSLSGDGYLVTESDPEGPVRDGVGSNMHFSMPPVDEDAYLRAEWGVIPTRLGGWGQDVRAAGVDAGSPWVVEFTGALPTLNAHIRSSTRVFAGEMNIISIDFTPSSLLSWKVNRVEQLSGMTPAWRGICAGDFSLQLQEFNDTNSATRWDYIRLYKVTPDDPSAVRLSVHDVRVQTQLRQPGQLLIGTASAMDKVFRQVADFRGAFAREVSISAAGREAESLQLVLIPIEKSLVNARVRAGDLLRMDANGRIASSNVQINVVDYIQTRPSNSSIRRAGWWWPDVLALPRPVTVRLGQVQPIWVTVHVPAGTPPGEYKGLLSIDSDTAPQASFKINLQVRAYDLPVRGELRTAFCICPGMWEIWYKPDEVKKRMGMSDSASHGALYNSLECEDVLPEAKWIEMYDFLLAHRLSPTMIYGGIRDGRRRVVPRREYMQHCYDRGMNATCLCSVDQLPADAAKADKYLRDLEALLRHWEPFVKEKNWSDFTWYIHGFDESEMRGGDKFDASIKRVSKLVHEKFPWVKLETANPYVPRYQGQFDIFTPLTAQWKTDHYPELLDKGQELWAYVCCGPGKPYANFFIDFPGHDPRVLGWQLFKHGAQGLLYYLINHYQPQINWNTSGPKWPQEPWNPYSYRTNSDGILIYPGPDATPLASTRLANIRDGIEDYEALALLRKKSLALEQAGGPVELLKQARDALTVDPQLAKSFREYTQDPAVIVAQRRHIDDLIETIDRQLSGAR